MTNAAYTRPAQGLGAAAIDEQEEQAALAVLRSRNLFRYYGDDPDNPPQAVAELEAAASEWLTLPYTLAVTSCTAALECALAAIGVGPGDEVIVPAWSWLSCVTSIVRSGARPVLAEIDGSLCIDPEEIGRLTTPRTKAVLVVHFQGIAADMEKIERACHRRGLFIIEDCAESPGTEYLGRPVGTWSDVAVYSFQHNKAMTAGEGGLLATRDKRIYERAVRNHDLGQFRPHHAAVTPAAEVCFSGGNYRMSEMTAAVAKVQMQKIPAIMAHCRKLKKQILREAGDLPGITWRPIPDPTGDFGYELYLYLPTAEQIAPFREALVARNVVCQPRTGTYPQYHRDHVKSAAAHHPAASPFRDLQPWPAPGYRAEDFPRTEDLTTRYIAIPIGWLYTAADATHIATTLREVATEQLG